MGETYRDDDEASNANVILEKRQKKEFKILLTFNNPQKMSKMRCEKMNIIS
jgi:hypothetical protein